MTSLAALDTAAQEHRLCVFGALHEASQTIVLLGPQGQGFWPATRANPEFQDGAPDPLDRWSKRVINQIALRFGATAEFPSDGPPYPPFIAWALASHRSWISPAGLLVHNTAGLFASYRGALRLPSLLDLPPAGANPCDSCAGQPCRTACPVGALTQSNYDVPACMAHIRTADSADCRPQGCAARRACPLSKSYNRDPDQSAFHMRAFLGEAT
jgi:epoxyqueuosine reductase